MRAWLHEPIIIVFRLVGQLMRKNEPDKEGGANMNVKPSAPNLVELENMFQQHLASKG